MSEGNVYFVLLHNWPKHAVLLFSIIGFYPIIESNLQEMFLKHDVSEWEYAGQLAHIYLEVRPWTLILKPTRFVKPTDVQSNYPARIHYLFHREKETNILIKYFQLRTA